MRHREVLGGVSVEMDPSRMLKLTRIYTGLPVFAMESLRTSKNCSVRFYPGGWMIIVTGNELFLWKYASTSQTQSRSACLKFTMPTSDLPHSARLVCLIFPGHGLESANASLPSGCLALGPCGQSLRLWPQLTRNYVHTDVTPSALHNGLYGDEAIQMEPISVPGAFLLATRTAHLVLVDARNAQNGVACRALVNRTSADTAHNNTSLLSGLSRRVSNLFSVVASTGGLGSRLLPARGGENTVFVRLITQPQTASNSSRVYLLTESQLDLWIIDENLEERLQNVHTIESLMPAEEYGRSVWHAADMAIRCGSKSDVLYLLTRRNHKPDVSRSTTTTPVCLISLTVSGTSVRAAQSIEASAVYIDWPPCAEPGEDFRAQTGGMGDTVQLCLPALTESESSGRGIPAYPCLLASIYCASVGQVAIVEVLTGNLVAKIDFGPQTFGEPGDQYRSSNVFALIGCGSVDPHNLFVFATSQRGLYGLVPTDEVSDGSLFVDGETSLESPLEVAKLRIASASMDLASSEVDKTSQDRGPLILVHAQSETLLVTVQLCAVGGLKICDARDSAHPVIKLPVSDTAFVTLCEAARIYWMGFEEQARQYLLHLVSEPALCAALPTAFLRLARRVLNERPRSDARWRLVYPNWVTCVLSDEQETLNPEGCVSFQFVTLPRTGEPVLPQARFEAKAEALNRLKELWSVTASVAAGGQTKLSLNSFVPVTELCTILGFRIPCSPQDAEADAAMSEPSASEAQRRLAGELDIREATDSDRTVGDKSEDCTEGVSRYFACTLADTDNGIESYASRLLSAFEPDRVIRAAEDHPPDGVGRGAVVHVLCGLHLAGELVEFTRAVYAKLAREPESTLQPVFRSVALEAGFSPKCLQVVGAQEAIMQTISLIPRFVAALGDAVTGALTNVTVDRPAPENSGSPSGESVDFLMVAVSVISAGLTELMRYRDRHLPVVEKALSESKGYSSPLARNYVFTHQLACWLTDARPYGVGDVLLELLEQLVQLGSGQTRPESSVSTYADVTQLAKDAAVQAIEWVEFILTIAQQRVRWASTRASWAWSDSHEFVQRSMDPDDAFSLEIKERVEVVQRVRRLRFWFASLRKRLICLVADRLNRPEPALMLAERFADCAEMVRLCYLLEVQDELAHEHDPTRWPSNEPDSLQQSTRFHHRRLAELLKRVPASYGLADHALQWYFACGEHARVQSLLSLLEQTQSKLESCKPESASGANVVPQPEFKVPSVTGLKGPETRKPEPPVCSSGDAISRFLLRVDARDHAWPHLLTTRQYAKAADILLEEGCKEIRFLGRRKTLLSLAKLAYLSSDSENFGSDQFARNQFGIEANSRQPERDDSTLTVIDLLLKCIQIQESLPDCLYRSPETSREKRLEPVLDLVTLARMYVSGIPVRDSSAKLKDADRARSGLPEFRSALLLADLIPHVHRFYPQLALLDPIETRTELALHIWCQAFKMDDWTQINRDEDPIRICSRSFACELVRCLRENYDNAMELLPTPNELCECAELEHLSDNPHFRFLLQSGFEYILGSSNEIPS